ncbi:hypothetical protein [Modestobacter sp. SYSU DS0875]
MRSFEDLVAEAEAAPVDGWDFTGFAGRATEERPGWGYARLLTARLARAATALDREGGFVCHSRRQLIEARRPG